MIKGSIQQEDIIFINTYAPNIGVPKYIKQILTDLKVEDGSNIIIRQILLLFLIKMFLATLCSMWDLSSPTRDRTHTPYIGSVES